MTSQDPLQAAAQSSSPSQHDGDDDKPTPILSLIGITKHFGALAANENISLSLHSGEIVALLGENGAGKTTLMNILFGHYRADSGSIEAFGKPLEQHTPEEALARGIGMVHQHFTLADNLSVLDNILLGTESLWQPFSRRNSARTRLQRIMSEAGLSVNIDAPVRDLSVGERQRVEILKALYRNVRILILDEPTAVLTPQEVDDLFVLLRSMAAQGLAIIIISHKLQEVMAISDRVVVLRAGQMVGAAVTATVSRDQLAEMIVGRQIERPSLEARTAGEELLSLRGVYLQDKGRERPTLDNINLQIRACEIVGVAGVSGNGQSSLADVLSGLRTPDEGEFVLHGNVQRRPSPRSLTRQGLARIPEDRHLRGVISEMSLWENLLLDELGTRPIWKLGMLLDRQAARAQARQLISDFDVRCSNEDQPAGLLSGGNMQKLILARNLARNPDIILANQPTRGLDEGAIAAVHTLLINARNQGAGVLLITEDLDELLRLSDRVVVMHNGHMSESLTSQGLSARELGLRMSGAFEESAKP
ncbi:ABC transporter ATP-binding protein [Granulosicoccus antarcticus]|uniref:Xylose import ATP-binding protein XylG n=1 Tax=Granulosicoccus antarcticus IMCC3135 TaxID=1192854 RepID=A0A2Z2NGS8_9GAMM|nr:ABC transporter ATP-binding protein [Granulosicoccus antarcticus]ASJ70482.1 Xylose import ATP-binding protein XylG [Granulosicoccus antarcticus IMCC3135]